MKCWDSLSDNSMSPTFYCSWWCLTNCTNINVAYFLYAGKIVSLMQCCITHSLSKKDWVDRSAYNDRLTHFLLVIWCNIRIICQKSKLSVNDHESLTSCRLWDNTVDDKRKHYSQTVVMRQNIRSMLVQCHLPTDINNIRACHQEYGDN